MKTNEQIDKEFVEKYRKNDESNKYEKPSLTADILVFTVREEKTENYRELSEKKLQLLMIKRKKSPDVGMWALPGGFAQPGETLMETAARELQEETSVENVYLEQLYTWSKVDRDPRCWVDSCSYIALVNSDNIEVKAGDDAADAVWFDVSFVETKKTVETENNVKTVKTIYELKLTNENDTVVQNIEVTKRLSNNNVEEDFVILGEKTIAFDHAKMIAYAMCRLRSKIDDIVPHLMSETFTIGDLQSVYSCISAKTYIGPNFRRQKMPMLEEVDDVQEQNAGHRPARYYRFNLEYFCN